ncbi:hypothetical protein AXG93_3109s1010 [Marchantia polymorpha subsp. ruderalis]|uniref:Uncharacterized protein n=1 Tax=Marchantia polymorpha subsp. ruderalis TaxID=1480154 RepID=A0A176VPV2_MARPO|nr:hypothetical protein AXG93_3109s1010 [Marchantia polymorpha subsp. ruderalis]
MATRYVMKHIVEELISFCTSPKGCLGVALVLSVIQTFCVEMLIPSHLRGAILIEKLKSDFIHSINDKLEEMSLERSHLMEKDELFHYEHCWPLIERHAGEISKRARDLLWESDVEGVVNEIRQEQIQQLESLQAPLISVDNDLAQCYPEAENMVSNLNFPQLKDYKPSTSKCLSQASTNAENHSTRLVLFKIDQLEEKLVQKVDDLDERLKSVQSILQRLEMKVRQILSLHQELQSMLSAFTSKVDRIIEYSQGLAHSRTPKRPYVTNNVGLFYKMSAHLYNGTTVGLHLMCESVTGFHTVKDQDGLKIRLDRENSSWIRKTIEIFYKVMCYVVKAGLDKTLSLGQAIPDWEDLKSDIVQLDNISDDDHRAFVKGGESKELREAWLRIQQTLAPQLQNRYSKIFKLYQVKYMSLERVSNSLSMGANSNGIDLKMQYASLLTCVKAEISASRLGQRLRGKQLRTVRLRPNGLGVTDTCAFGGTELLRQKRLRRDKRYRQKGQDELTAVNAYGPSAFGDAPTSTDIFKDTPSAL